MRLNDSEIYAASLSSSLPVLGLLSVDLSFSANSHQPAAIEEMPAMMRVLHKRHRYNIWPQLADDEQGRTS